MEEFQWLGKKRKKKKDWVWELRIKGREEAETRKWYPEWASTVWPVLRVPFPQAIPEVIRRGRIACKNVGFWTQAGPPWAGFPGARTWPGQHY